VSSLVSLDGRPGKRRPRREIRPHDRYRLQAGGADMPQRRRRPSETLASPSSGTTPTTNLGRPDPCARIRRSRITSGTACPRLSGGQLTSGSSIGASRAATTLSSRPRRRLFLRWPESGRTRSNTSNASKHAHGVPPAVHPRAREKLNYRSVRILAGPRRKLPQRGLSAVLRLVQRARVAT
jgi:hypothetical protein